MSDVCCDRMKQDLERTCALHPERWQCVDNMIHRGVGGLWGLFIHDGGSSWYEISFCPWCGSALEK